MKIQRFKIAVLLLTFSAFFLSACSNPKEQLEHVLVDNMKQQIVGSWSSENNWKSKEGEFGDLQFYPLNTVNLEFTPRAGQPVMLKGTYKLTNSGHINISFDFTAEKKLEFEGFASTQYNGVLVLYMYGRDRSHWSRG